MYEFVDYSQSLFAHFSLFFKTPESVVLTWINCQEFGRFSCIEFWED